MIRLLTFILITAVLVGCTVWFADNPGRMTVVWLGYRFDGSIGMVALALLALTAICVLIWHQAMCVRRLNIPVRWIVILKTIH